MTKSFDEICENIMAGTQAGAKPAPGAPQTTPAPGTPQPTPAAAQPQQQQNQINDDELFKVLQQKMNDQKFKDALLKMLTPQPNAANKPNY